MVDLGGNSVHPVSRRTHENLIFARNAEEAEEAVYCSIGANAKRFVDVRVLLV